MCQNNNIKDNCCNYGTTNLRVVIDASLVLRNMDSSMLVNWIGPLKYFVFKGCLVYLFLNYFPDTSVFNSNSEDRDQMVGSTALDPGLHCLKSPFLEAN